MTKNSENLSHIIPTIEDWPISQFSQDRDEFIQRLIDYTMNRLLQSNSNPYEILSKTLYLERQRVKNNPWAVDPQDEKIYLKTLTKELEDTKNAEDPAQEELKILRRLVHRYSEEIIGFFLPKTHRFARRFLTSFFKRIFNNGWGRGQRWIWGNKKDLLRKIKVDGHVEELRALFEKGTVVIVPTHYSNLDSIMIGYGLDMKASIPAFAYGAGLNLYDYEILAYFMNRLGAYRVDRRKKNPIYLETLKSMASLSLIEGLNHIFFPGGTRSRSGAIEDKLKLGLLNSVIDAQRHCIVNDIDQKIFVIPLALGYHFVFEAYGLTNQHLKIIGREKFTRKRKSDSILKTILTFLRLLRRHDSEVYLSFGRPMDVLGNYVDKDGESYDERGKKLNIEKYFSLEDVPNQDTQRESVYTRILAEKIVHSFKAENIILSSHLLAFVVFNIIKNQNPELDLFDLLKISIKEIRIPIEDVVDLIGYYQKILNEKYKQGEVKLSEPLKEDAMGCFKDGMRNVGIYHTRKVLKLMDRKHVGTEDLRLLYYYHNKMKHYELPVDRPNLNEIIHTDQL
ncbi:MAG: 1-acyl-sn-glycerol-3-phosphate acyltransferase [Bacteroidia bacterium]|nr:1-acyl-sn-glycerol-3-phosphate acyltransferase [Bacteroidia bacterium]NNK90006.1 glycerol acyltransferase [Saprospiraceae bacterium]